MTKPAETPAERKNARRINVWIPTELLAQLESLADNECETLSTVIRMACRKYVAEGETR